MSGGDWKAMFKAVQEGDYELVKYYLKMGIDPNYQHPEYMAAPLIEAIRFNQIKVIKLLLDNGADPKIKEVIDAETPSIVAKRLRNTKALELLKPHLSK